MSFFQVWTRQTYQRDCPVCGALWQSQTIWTVMAMISLSPRNSSTQWSPPEITRTYTESSSWTRKGDAYTAYVRSVLLHLYFFLCIFPLRIHCFFLLRPHPAAIVFTPLTWICASFPSSLQANYLIMLCGHVPIINYFI